MVKESVIATVNYLREVVHYKILRRLSVAVAKNVLVPDYLYSARVDDADIPWFENQYFRDVNHYDDDVRETEDRFQYAKRMGYVFLNQLKSDTEKYSPGRKFLNSQICDLGGKGFTWATVPSWLNENSIIYAFGAGTDISFEVEIAKKLNCVVKCFDPTPQAIDYATKIANKDPLIDFYPIGVYSEDTTLRFYRPPDVGLGSLSISNLNHGESYVEAPVARLATLMEKFGDSHIDLLKMDIEGAEYDVLDDMFASGLEVDQLALEFDQPIPPWRTERYIRKLLGAGYDLVDVQGLNCLFVNKKMLDAKAN